MAGDERVGRRAALRTVGALGLAGATGAGAAVAGNGQTVHAQANGHEFVGSWIVTGVDPAPRLLQTFTIDGCTIGTDSEHPHRTPSHGAWVHLGERRFLTRHM